MYLGQIRFLNWPDDALEKVATMFFDETQLDEDNKTQCILMCKHFHTTIAEAADQFYEELRRRTYITPTSYLELILTFKNLYQHKVDQINMQRNR